MLLWFITTAHSHCSLHLSSCFGFTTYSKEVPDGTTICFNISQFPFFFVPHSLPLDALLDEYISLENTSVDHKVYTYSDILPFRFLLTPFSTHSLTLPTGGNVSFVYGSPVGSCRDGIVFTNSPRTNISLETASASATSALGVNDDKCVVFTTPGRQSFALRMQTEECCGKLFLYEDGMETIRAFSGDIDVLYFTVNASAHPPLFRVMTDAKNLTNFVSLRIDSDAAEPEDVFSVFWDPWKEEEIHELCTFWMTVDWIIIGMVAGACGGVVVVFSLMFWVTAKCCCSHFLRPGKETDSKDSGKKIGAEVRNEPAGYFALDPILRPND